MLGYCRGFILLQPVLPYHRDDGNEDDKSDLGQEHYICSKDPSLPALAVPNIESELRELLQVS
jgi:hypothetical protein